VELRQSLEEAVEELRRVVAYDEQIEARLGDGQIEEVCALVAQRAGALERLMQAEEALREASPSLVEERGITTLVELRDALRTLAERRLAATKEHVDRLQQLMKVCKEEIDALRANRRRLRRYLSGSEGQRADFTC